jgi:hypothetical protein
MITKNLNLKRNQSGWSECHNPVPRTSVGFLEDLYDDKKL